MSTSSLLTWRRTVADLYAHVRGLPAADGHAAWVDGRDELFRTHPDSPLAAGDPLRASGLPVAPYDPAWRAVCALETGAPQEFSYETGTDGRVTAGRLGVLKTPWGALDAWWLSGYGGGLFVPVKDASAGRETYGGGRYLLDSVKGADLGGSATEIVVDLNFAYHPSCRYDPAWACPLAPAGNILDVDVPVGERLEHTVAEFAFPGPLRDRLVAAILAGDKTTTAGLLRGYELEGEPLPRPGARQVVVDSAGAPVALIQIEDCRTVRVADVDLEHAVAEGEGDRTVAEWRAGHTDFWEGEQSKAELGEPDFTVTDDTLVVLERFRLVRRL